MVLQYIQQRKQHVTAPKSNNVLSAHDHDYAAKEPTSYPPIAPLPAFNWETADPLVFRPFKPKYHLTMGLSTLSPSELIPMDKTYKERLQLRAQLLRQYPDVVRAVNTQNSPETNAKIKEALCEWYAFIMGTYLPTRYPKMFRLVPGNESEDGEKKSGTILESLVTGLKAPVDPEQVISGTATTQAGLLSLLDTLSTWIDEDYLILLPSTSSPTTRTNSSPPSPEEEEGGGITPYILQSYSTYYPAGFDTRTKLGRPLAEIHSPVPGYKAKLEKSMDRFFARIEVGKFVVRTNWSVMTPGNGLFAAFGGLHDVSSAPGENGVKNGSAAAQQQSEKGKGKEKDEIPTDGFDGKDTYLRVERQTLHRLPKSKALVFAFHTYLYPLQDIKDEGLGEEMAAAIDGLKEGSVPAIHTYKRGPYWGEAVKAFLRS
ncbi:hypothetical protein BJX61DRAFT_275241 [Aspergillus egyptiacus]|nr:hypothetical protein BJX61DRAFT_275241 [Aspergillus egyptiacus]